MSAFVTLRVDTGPNGIVTLEMPGATSLRYAALRFAEHLGLDTDEFCYFLLDTTNRKGYPPDQLASDFDGTTFLLGCGPLGR